MGVEYTRRRRKRETREQVAKCNEAGPSKEFPDHIDVTQILRINCIRAAQYSSVHHPEHWCGKELIEEHPSSDKEARTKSFKRSPNDQQDGGDRGNAGQCDKITGPQYAIIYLGSSLKGVGKTDFWVGLGSDRLGSTVSRGDARHRSFPVGAWVEVAVDGDVQRVCGREWSARFVRGFSAWEPVRLRGVRRRGLCGSRHEGRDVAASGLLPASHAVACAARDLSEVRGAQGRYPVGS